MVTDLEPLVPDLFANIGENGLGKPVEIVLLPLLSFVFKKWSMQDPSRRYLQHLISAVRHCHSQDKAKIAELDSSLESIVDDNELGNLKWRSKWVKKPKSQTWLNSFQQ